jgi:Nucleotidyltransferase domain
MLLLYAYETLRCIAEVPVRDQRHRSPAWGTCTTRLRFGRAWYDTEESDLDLLVDPSPHTTLMTLAAIQLDAEHLLGVHVDVLTPNSIPQRIRDRVLLEAIPV